MNLPDKFTDVASLTMGVVVLLFGAFSLAHWWMQ